MTAGAQRKMQHESNKAQWIQSNGKIGNHAFTCQNMPNIDVW
jgi:hypothetical protein